MLSLFLLLLVAFFRSDILLIRVIRVSSSGLVTLKGLFKAYRVLIMCSFNIALCVCFVFFLSSGAICGHCLISVIIGVAGFVDCVLHINGCCC